jgi:hypothetical protein
MPAIPTQATIDPLSAFIADASAQRGRPIPLVSTNFDVEIDGGLATVVTKRLFRNDEAESIEATITFPVPVHAVLFDLSARIDGRAVKARAQRRTQAREVYEDAIERGKAAVLHEEVLRGVHMLSVAHLGPGKEIEVTTVWAAALNFVGDRGKLRIPLTIGDIYGRSGLPDSDDLFIGGPVQTADLFVRCTDGAAAVRGVKLEEGRARIPLNVPIDLAVTPAAARDLRGVAADGREVVLRISPHQAGDKALNVAVLVDHSSSMEEACSDEASVAEHCVTKHEAVIVALRSVAQGLRDDDVVDLWEFDDRLGHVGSSHDPAPQQRGVPRLMSLIARLTHPAGGTEIGMALAGAIAGSEACDILLITDGKSYALDVHALARKGRRITVLLVGEDSLEANVGHLAALSGGDIFVAAEEDIAGTLATAIGSLRTPSERPGPVGTALERICVVRGNALLEAEWRPAAGPVSEALRHRSAAVMAASLALPILDEERAAALAEAEGLVTHLTSLVLIDEEGESQEDIAATRKVALPRPRRMVTESVRSTHYYHSFAGGRAADESRYEGFEDAALTPPEEFLDIDWESAPNQLLAGDLSVLAPRCAALIAEMATVPDVIAVAKRTDVSPIVLVVALIALTQAGANRSAARIAKAILGKDLSEAHFKIMALLGLY